MREFVESGAAGQYRGVTDLVSGGVPCQPYSTAPSGKNKSDDAWEYAREAIGIIWPKYIFLENVSKAAIEYFAKDLAEMGCLCKAIKVSAADLGADHVRARYWLLAHTNNKGQLCGENYAEMAELPELRCSIWESSPDHSRMDDGVANWGKRIKSVGNVQVPAVAAIAWQTLIKESK